MLKLYYSQAVPPLVIVLHKILEPSDLRNSLVSEVGYRHVKLHPDDKEKTAFTTGQGLWQFKVMPFGLCNAPATFERLMETIIEGLSYEACLVYIDDIIIVGRFFEEHLKNIRRVLQKLKGANPVFLKLWDTPPGGHDGQDCLSKPERNYCVTRKELLAIVKAVEPFHPYLYGRRFLLRTVHASLTWLLNFKNSEGQIARWIQRLQEYDVEIRHRKGSAHGNVDALSRRPCPESCKYCSRIEKKFGVKDPIVRQVTAPSISALDPWSDESVRNDELADPEIKPITEFKQS
ncbi:retrovirus-related Pol polyprotein from transposon 17.6 [Trichonephila clavipes]|nr:retrovirus-related Pol polyprotein from transposon 17.6 [Trichonephila clavipes]